MKKLLLVAAFAAACSSSNTNNTGTDAAVTSDARGTGGSACEALCAGGTCGATCVAECTAGAAPPSCAAQYNAVVRCAAAAGQRCMLRQGGGAPCTAVATALSTCIAGGATDAGSTATDTGSTMTAGIVGTWSSTSTSKTVRSVRTLTFMGGPNSGMVRLENRRQQGERGCLFEFDVDGTWTLASGTLTVNFTSGTNTVSMCAESWQNSVAPIDALELMNASMNYSGDVTITNDMLTFMGGGMGTFTRASGG